MVMYNTYSHFQQQALKLLTTPYSDLHCRKCPLPNRSYI